jgi:hypothetical protein
MMEYLYLLLIPIFAWLNRWRGSDLFRGFAPSFARFAYGFCLSTPFWFDGTWEAFYKTGVYYWVGAYLLFRLGENWGWGKWQGGLLNYYFHKMQSKAPELTLLLELKKSEDNTLWIHTITSWIYKQEEEPFLYCFVGLCIRGFFWWVPLIAPMAYLTGWPGLIWTVPIALCFPLSVSLAARFDFPGWMVERNLGRTITEEWQAGSEWIYGAMQGAIFAIYFIWGM